MGNSMSSHRKPPPPPPRRVPLLALLILLKYGPAPAGAGRPRVTAALIAANALVYYRPGDLDAYLPRLRDVTFNPHLIIKYGDLRRFFLSAFYHMGETHFLMNMASLLWTGVQLETSIGSSEFASMVVSLLGLSQGFTLLLSKALLLLGYKAPYYQFSAGFSGVVLGMNVVLNSRAEAFNPKAHLIGNVGGILAGLAYLWLKRGTEPFALMFSGIADIVSQPVRFARRLLRSPARHRGSSVQGHVASVPRETGHGMWRCTTCCSDNSPSTDVCETCSTQHQDHGFSRRQLLQDGGNSELSVEEIRRRRLQRFGTGHGMWRCTTCCSDNSPATDVCEMCNTQHQDHGFSCRQLLQDGGNRELSVEEIRRRRLQRFEK